GRQGPTLRRPPRLTPGRDRAGLVHRTAVRRLRPGAALRAGPRAGARHPAGTAARAPPSPAPPRRRLWGPPPEPAPATRLELPTAADGVVPLDRIGAVAIGDLRRLDGWGLRGYGGGGLPPLRGGA